MVILFKTKSGDIMLGKYAAPSKLDVAPYRTVWQFQHSSGDAEYWIQMGPGESAQWERLGIVMERACERMILSDIQFVDDIVETLEQKEDKIEPEA